MLGGVEHVDQTVPEGDAMMMIVMRMPMTMMLLMMMPTLMPTRGRKQRWDLSFHSPLPGSIPDKAPENRNYYFFYIFCSNLSIVGLDLAELVHELKLVDANVAAPVSGSEVLPVRGDADAADTVALVVQGVLP